MGDLMFETRRVPRREVNSTHGVVVHRDRRDLSYEGAVRRLGGRRGVSRVFDLVGEVSNTSDGGVGVRFSGQTIRALNLFKRRETYWIKLTLGGTIWQAPTAFIRGRDLPFLLLKAICCWHRSAGEAGLSLAGFELDRRGNHPAIAAFVRSGFGSYADPHASPVDPGPIWLRYWSC